MTYLGEGIQAALQVIDLLDPVLRFPKPTLESVAERLQPWI